jgi:hypothetical protein
MSPMKISDSEMQRIHKPAIYNLCNAFWNAYPAGYLPYRTYRRKGSSDKANRIASFTSSKPSSLGDDG